MTRSSVQEQKYIAMTNGSVELLVCKMALPTMAIMMISAIYNMADTYFVGKIGTSATAGVAIVFSLMGVIQATGFFFGHGSGSYISRKLGEKKIEEAEYMAATGVFLSFLFGLLFSFIGLWNLEPLAIILGATDTILPYAKDYMRFILLAMPFMSSSLTMNNQLRLQGSAFYGMIGMISGAILNFILDPILIFWFDMGVAGAGLATMISQLFSFSILFIASSQDGNIRIHIDNFRPRIKYFTEIFRGGFPSLCRQALGSISILALNHSAGIYGDAAIAAMSIASRSANLSFSILIGFGQGFQPVCGFNYGAKLYARVKKAFWFCVKFSTVVMSVIGLLGYRYAPEIIGFFRRGDAEVVSIGASALRYQCVAFPLLGWSTFCNMMLQTIGQSFRASVLAISRQGLFYLPLLFIMGRFYGISGIQVSQPLADLLSFCLAIPLCLSVLKEMK